MRFAFIAVVLALGACGPKVKAPRVDLNETSVESAALELFHSVCVSRVTQPETFAALAERNDWEEISPAEYRQLRTNRNGRAWTSPDWPHRIVLEIAAPRSALDWGMHRKGANAQCSVYFAAGEPAIIENALSEIWVMGKPLGVAAKLGNYGSVPPLRFWGSSDRATRNWRTVNFVFRDLIDAPGGYTRTIEISAPLNPKVS